ncbi:hypothetical protein TrCOL_g4863 [Triparma columacea]|uniref:Cyclic nucleotide-binding domain-containing protein n=1 Tax=Triparma columacea TaxID=722753 RepID=A0A9W7GPR3_9STRA|nr:hypothetical protein TrCOL_g4863 [Triparma columacea]
MLRRGYTDDIIEDERPSTAERRKKLSITDSFDEAVAEVEKLDGRENTLNPLGEVDTDVTNVDNGRPGAHTMYHGQRQHTMFKKLEKLERKEIFDDDESDEEFPEGSQGGYTINDEQSTVSAITMGDNSPNPANYSKVDFGLDADGQLQGQGSVSGESFVDDQSINEFASQYGSHAFPDPDIQGHPVQLEQGIHSVQKSFPQLQDIRYRKDDVFPNWMLKSDDWRKMKGIIKHKELMAAFKEGSHLRTPAQLDLIKTWLVSNWDMAAHLGQKRCTALAKAVVYEKIKTGAEIIREGDRGYIFYIIIQGSVAIYKKGYGLITTLGKGRFFGERALTSNECEVRQATVVVASEPTCEVLVLHKSAYDSIIKSYQENLRTEAYRVLKQVPLFSQWGRRMLERVCILLERRQVPANTLIFRQGDAPDFIYFIVDGNIEILKEITVFSKNRWPKLGGGTEEVVRKKVNKFKILDIGPGKYFGEIAIVNNTSRAATCQTTEPTILLALDKFEFLNLLHKGHAMANVYSQTQGYPNDEHILHLFSQLVVKKQEKKDIKKTRSKRGYDSKVGGILSNKAKGQFRGTATLPTDYGNKHGSSLSKANMAEAMAGAPMKKGNMITNESHYEKIMRDKKAMAAKIEKKMAEEGHTRRYSDYTLPVISQSPIKSEQKKKKAMSMHQTHKNLLKKQRKISVQLANARKTSISNIPRGASPVMSMRMMPKS